MDKRLKEYYLNNASLYIANTSMLGMSNYYDLFFPYLIKRARLLDCGFGSGRDTLHFKTVGCEVFSIDLNKSFVERLNKAGIVTAYEIDFLKAPYDGYFDALWMADFLPMFYLKDYHSVFSKMHSLLREDGVAFISTRSSNDTVVKGDAKGISFFENIDDIYEYTKGKFEVLKMVPVAQAGAPIESNTFYAYVLKKI